MPSAPEPARSISPEDAERLASLNLTNPASPPVLTVAQIQAAVADQLDQARRDLAGSRQRRDDLNDKIRAQVTHVEELERIHRSLNPAKRKAANG